MPAKPKPVKVAKKKSKYMKHGKKSSRQLLDTELNALVRSIVLLRDGCCVCPSPDNGHGSRRQPGHLISRGKISVKWDLRNVNEQCDSCNFLHEHYPERYTAWYIAKFGPDEYRKLVEDAATPYKFTVDDLYELRTQLQEIYELQQADMTFKPRFSQKQVLTGEWRTLRGIEVMTSYRLDNFAGAEAV